MRSDELKEYAMIKQVLPYEMEDTTILISEIGIRYYVKGDLTIVAYTNDVRTRHNALLKRLGFKRA